MSFLTTNKIIKNLGGKLREKMCEMVQTVCIIYFHH